MPPNGLRHPNLDVELERKRRRCIVGARREDLSYKISKAKRHRQTIREAGTVEVQFRERHQIR